MITKIEAKNYKALEYVSQSLRPFQVMIGPNASGKSTFLDVPAFIGDIISIGLKRAIEMRGTSLDQLTFKGQGGDLELALELKIPTLLLESDPDVVANVNIDLETIRYEIRIRTIGGLPSIVGERLILIDDAKYRRVYPNGINELGIVFEKITRHVYRTLLTRSENSMVAIKTIIPNQRSAPGFYLDQDKSAISAVFEDLTRYKLHIWAKRFLTSMIKKISLDGDKLRQPSAYGSSAEFGTNGSNLAFLIDNLKSNNSVRFSEWMSHLKITLTDIEDITIESIPNLAQKFIVVQYSNGASIPSWLLSDGTLRIIGLTIIPYLDDNHHNLYLIEEPENGVHPKALESVFQSLSSVYDDQIFLATHSPMFLAVAKPIDLIIFRKDHDGGIQIRSGLENPILGSYT